MKMKYSNPRKSSMKYRKNRTYYPFNSVNKFGFTWTVKKVLTQGEWLNCWMTSGVSSPMPLAKSA